MPTDGAAAGGLAWLTELPRPADDPVGFVAEALRQLCAAYAAVGGRVSVDRDDGAGPRTWARHGAAPADHDLAGDASLRVPLDLSTPWRGELSLAGVGPDARTLARLIAERISLVIDNHRLREAGARAQAWQAYLGEVGELLAQSLDVDLTAALIAQLVVPRLGQWCAVHTVNGESGPALAAAIHADESAVGRLRHEIERACHHHGVEDLWHAGPGARPLTLPPPLDGLALALAARGERIGMLWVGRHAERRHDLDEIAVLEDVARRAAFALDNARTHERERRLAERLQASLLPPTLPQVDGIGFGAAYVPMGREVGGDFYDVIALPDGRWLVVVGDVSGKGVSAAVVTGLVREVVRVLIRDARPVAHVLARLNETLAERGAGHFCTLALATVAGPAADGHLQVEVHLAGHEPPVLVRANGTAGLVGLFGTALGLLESITSSVLELRLAPGDALVFYTDGVTERRRGPALRSRPSADNELFGPRRLCEAASGLAGLPADAIAAGLRAAALGFGSEPPRDDIAVLAIRNDGPARASEARATWSRPPAG